MTHERLRNLGLLRVTIPAPRSQEYREGWVQSGDDQVSFRENSHNSESMRKELQDHAYRHQHIGVTDTHAYYTAVVWAYARQ